MKPVHYLRVLQKHTKGKTVPALYAIIATNLLFFGFYHNVTVISRLSNLCPTIVGRLTDNYQQACRQL